MLGQKKGRNKVRSTPGYNGTGGGRSREKETRKEEEMDSVHACLWSYPDSLFS